MKRYLLVAACALAVMPLAAQETYENAKIVTEDLNGTARYVGMGGAMEALGADISTIGSNPAGLGLFRRTTANTSFRVVGQQGVKDFSYGNKTKMSFDQLGFVFAHRSGERSFLNFGFNYHKNRDFNHILQASDRLIGASQNKISYAKGLEGLFDLKVKDGEIVGTGNAFNQLDYLYYNALMADKDNNYYFNEATGYTMNRAVRGHVNEYDFNLSGNIGDRFYLGLTIGVKDVLHKQYSEYTEQLVDDKGKGVGTVTIADERRIDGSGFDIKMGAIVRPVEASPFRMGFYIHTPTWYDLTTQNYTTLANQSTVGLYDKGKSEETYKFKLYSPWKFGVSLGHTIGNYLAFGATYEYADYGSIDTRINTGEGYDWYYGDYYETSESDANMNKHTQQTLKGVSTLKVGAEFKVAVNLAFRLGYNYVSPMYRMEGYKDGTVNSPGSFYSSATDYTNWKGIDRITFGLGYTVGKLNLDLAYQYSKQTGEFSPFMTYDGGPGSKLSPCICNPVKVNNERHQVLLSLGYRF